MQRLQWSNSNYCRSATQLGGSLSNPRLEIPLRLSRCLWMWVPGRRIPTPTYPPLPRGFSLDHPDNLPPPERYMLRITGPFRYPAIEQLYARVPLTVARHHRCVYFSFAGAPGWECRSGERCQLVWDAETESIALYTEQEHPVPGTKRYLKDLLAVSPTPTSGLLLVNTLVRHGHITQEGERIMIYHAICEVLMALFFVSGGPLTSRRPHPQTVPTSL